MIEFAWVWVLYLASLFTLPDLVNGAFELGGGLLSLLNVRAMLHDKKVRGFSIVPLTLFTTWGYWNVFYYPHLDQWASFAGGLVIAASNTAWLGLAIYYTRNERLDAAQAP